MSALVYGQVHHNLKHLNLNTIAPILDSYLGNAVKV